MKRLRLILPLILCLLLSGCGSRAAQDRFLSFSQALRERESLDFTADVRCEYPDKTVDFTLQYALRGDEQTVTVTAPESIAGVRARISPEGNQLLFDSLVLDMGEPDGSLNPAGALPLLVEALRQGHPDSFWQEDGADAVRLILDDRTTVSVTFAPEDMRPVRAEILLDDRVTARCDIRDWR